MSPANGNRNIGTENSTENKLNPLVLVEIITEGKKSAYRFLRTSELSALKVEHRILYRNDVETGSLVRVHSSENAIDLPSIGTSAFLKGIETALNRIAETGRQGVDAQSPIDNKVVNKERVRAISSMAMDAATDCFFELMENTIDRWTYDASSKMLSELALQNPGDLIVRRREAAEIQVKSKKLNSEFRAFVIENLVNFKCEDADSSEKPSPLLELVSSDGWQNRNIEQVLTRECEGQTKVEFSQLNRRLSAILDRKLAPAENVLGPQAIAANLSQSLNECGYTGKQRAALEPIIISDFNSALENLYHQINTIWIGMDILPEAKLEILKSDVA